MKSEQTKPEQALKTVVFGDSRVGNAADGTGGMGKALSELAPELGLEIVEVVGVGGSMLGQWLRAAKGEPVGRWTPKSKMPPLTDAQKERADLRRLAGLNADVYILVFSANEAASKISARTFRENVAATFTMLPDHARVILLQGDGFDAQRQMVEGLKDLSPRLLALSSTDAPRAYQGEGIHPDKGAHADFLMAVQPQIQTHLAGLVGGLAGSAVGLVQRGIQFVAEKTKEIAESAKEKGPKALALGFGAGLVLLVIEWWRR